MLFSILTEHLDWFLGEISSVLTKAVFEQQSRSLILRFVGQYFRGFYVDGRNSIRRRSVSSY